MNILQIMFRENIFSINQISLQLRILYIQNLIVKLFNVLITHSILIQKQIISNYNLQLLSPNVTASIVHLSFVRVYIFWLLTETMSVLSVDFRDDVLFFLVKLYMINESYLTLLNFSSF